MSKGKNINKKNNKIKNVKTQTVKKNISKKIDLMGTNASNEVLKILRILLVVIIVLGGFYLLTLVIVGNDDKDEVVETKIQYEEILAGSSFTMNESEYLVVYYDFADTELTDLTSQIYNYTYNGKYIIYTVDMSSGFNKSYTSEEKSNTKPESAEDLLINGPTLIKISGGKVVDYVEGSDNIIKYLQ